MIASLSADQCYHLRRNEAQSNIILNSFRKLFNEKSLFDCSIVCEGKVIKGHKFILSAVSEYFKTAFTSFNNSCQNTALLICDVPYHDLKNIIDFIYKGEAKIEEKQLSSFQKSVQSLKIACLDSLLSFQSLDLKSSDQSSPLSSPTPSQSLHNLDSSKSLEGQQLTNCSRPLKNVGYPGHYRNTNGFFTSISSSSKVIYQPHEPFVQLRELLKRDSSAKNSLSNNKLSKVNNQLNEAKEYFSREDFEDMVIPRVEMNVTHDDSNDQRDESKEESFEKNGFDLSSHSNEQVIDMSVNSLHLDKLSTKDKEEITNNENNCSTHQSSESDLNEIDEKKCLSLVSSKSYSILPLSVNIPSSFSYATARAIAASTTLAVASGLLSNSHHSSLEENLNSSSSQHLTENAENVSLTSQVIPLKRGRGRPPRHLRDGQEDLKSLKISSRTSALSPNTSSESSSSGLKLTNTKEPTPLKKRRISLDTLMNIKERMPKMSSPAIDIHGKNVCPYCPQVYYSNQAMNDHINNVHTGKTHKYTCSMCSKEFSWKISLTKHLRNSHKEEKMDLEEKGILIL